MSEKSKPVARDYYTIERMRTLTDLKHAPVAIEDKYGNIMLAQSFSVVRNLSNTQDMILLGVKPITVDEK